ncbi:ABC transporter permease [Sutcliffiella halmapala]|uniref:ABC transporter permease n=1 Tax=Sutcliffiella halmapala TaxID=79882 RepID=UPI0009955BDE|nr:ABC transporter permease [Sutcliffiella halmapala]
MKELSITWALHDGWVMFRRNLKHIFRNPESLMVSIFLPVMMMLLFVFVFGGAIQTGTEYVNYIVPGIIITCVGYGSSMTAMSVTQDMVGGLFDRFRSMPIHPSSLLVGHVAGSFVRNMISTTLVILVAVLVGFRPNASFIEWLGALGLLSLFLLSISWLSVIFGLLAKNIETASAFSFIIMFAPYISSAFVPTETMPSWLHAFAENQPMTPLIDTLRGLLIGTPIGNHAWLAIVWFGGILLVSFVVAMVIFKRRNRE